MIRQRQRNHPQVQRPIYFDERLRRCMNPNWLLNWLKQYKHFPVGCSPSMKYPFMHLYVAQSAKPNPRFDTLTMHDGFYEGASGPQEIFMEHPMWLVKLLREYRIAAKKVENVPLSFLAKKLKEIMEDEGIEIY